jgi:hypothetical protein
MEQVQKTTLSCVICGVKLVDIIVVEDNERRSDFGEPERFTSYVCHCYKCGGKSAKTKYFGGTCATNPCSDKTYIVGCEAEEVEKHKYDISLKLQKE